MVPPSAAPSATRNPFRRRSAGSTSQVAPWTNIPTVLDPRPTLRSTQASPAAAVNAAGQVLRDRVVDREPRRAHRDGVGFVIRRTRPLVLQPARRRPQGLNLLRYHRHVGSRTRPRRSGHGSCAVVSEHRAQRTRRPEARQRGRRASTGSSSRRAASRVEDRPAKARLSPATWIRRRLQPGRGKSRTGQDHARTPGRGMRGHTACRRRLRSSSPCSAPWSDGRDLRVRPSRRRDHGGAHHRHRRLVDGPTKPDLVGGTRPLPRGRSTRGAIDRHQGRSSSSS